ncbi:MAG: hypothetical protein LBM93_14595 [Oscillospiraceae bacterium]|jgi:hypothetical protein|nr:hypothetical protein [Oscillospiraceae bacterium]
MKNKHFAEIAITTIGLVLVVGLMTISALKTKDNTAAFNKIANINEEIRLLENNIITKQSEIERESGYATINNYAENTLKLKKLNTEQIVYIAVPVEYEVDKIEERTWFEKRLDDFKRLLEFFQS